MKQYRTGIDFEFVRVPLQKGELCQIYVESKDYVNVGQAYSSWNQSGNNDSLQNLLLNTNNDNISRENKSWWVGPCVVSRVLPGMRGYVVWLEDKTWQKLQDGIELLETST